MVNGKEIGVAGLIILFIGIIVAVSFLPEIADTTKKMTDKITVTNESHTITSAGLIKGDRVNDTYPYTITNAPSGWDVDNCPTESFTLSMSNGTAFTVTTDYVLTASTGTFTLENSDAINKTLSENNFTGAGYKYCDEGYVGSAGGRAVANILVLMSILGLLGFVVFYAVRRFS